MTTGKHQLLPLPEKHLGATSINKIVEVWSFSYRGEVLENFGQKMKFQGFFNWGSHPSVLYMVNHSIPKICQKSHDNSYQEVTICFAPSIIASKYQNHRFQTICQKRREKTTLCRFHWKYFIPLALKGTDAEPQNMFHSSWHQISRDLQKLAEFQTTHISYLIKSRCILKLMSLPQYLFEENYNMVYKKTGQLN